MGVTSQRHGEVAEITLDWPEKRNALGPDEGRELRLAIESAATDENVGAIVLSANGEAFCAGGDLPQIIRLADEGGADSVRSAIYDEFQGVFRAITEAPIPVIAAVDGPAVGFGCDLALAGSVTFIGDRGWLAQGWNRAGLIPATGGALYVKRRGGTQAVYRLLAADRVDGPTAEQWNLAIASDDARAAALDMAAKFASYPREPLRALVDLSRIDEKEAHLEQALNYQTGFITHRDFRSFAEKFMGK
jgi:enoyl-CoA hydratase/carnithine racemase